MGKSRRKKNEKKDFKKVKLRVGRKVEKTKETKLSFVSKKICLREDSVKNEAFVSSAQIIHLSAILPRLSSRHNEDLVSALGDLRVWMKREPEDARQLLLLELPGRLGPLARHLDGKVRTAAGKVFGALLHLTAACPAYYPALAQTMFGALLHFDVGVRDAGWDYLRLLLEAAPQMLPALNSERLLEELSRRLPQESGGLNWARTSRQMRIVEKLVETLDPISPLDEARTTATPEQTAKLLQPFRLAQFDFQTSALPFLWTNSQLPRATEQGSGWNGPARFRLSQLLSAIAPWLLSHAKEFRCLDTAVRSAEGKAKLDLLPRLLSLISLLSSALQHHLFREPLTPAATSAFGAAAATVWRLFPVPDDSPLFSCTPRPSSSSSSSSSADAPPPLRLNLSLIRLNCLRRLLPAKGQAEEEATDVTSLGAFFNDVMGPLWPLKRWLCLQWLACAELSALGRRCGAWLELLASVARRIEATQGGGADSKVMRSCQRVASAVEAMPATENDAGDEL